MKTSVLIPTALCNLLSEKWNSTISAILINWENTALHLWRSGQSLYSGYFYEKSKEWTMTGKIRFLKCVQMLQRCFTGGSWVRTSQAEMPCPGAVLMKSSKIPKRLGKPPPFTAESPKPRGKLILCRWARCPWLPSPSADSCWSKSLGCALLNSRFHLYQSFSHIPGQKSATWPKYSN